jgi:hypothetical protein
MNEQTQQDDHPVSWIVLRARAPPGRLPWEDDERYTVRSRILMCLSVDAPVPSTKIHLHNLPIPPSSRHPLCRNVWLHYGYSEDETNAEPRWFWLWESMCTPQGTTPQPRASRHFSPSDLRYLIQLSVFRQSRRCSCFQRFLLQRIAIRNCPLA